MTLHQLTLSENTDLEIEDPTLACECGSRSFRGQRSLYYNSTQYIDLDNPETNYETDPTYSDYSDAPDEWECIECNTYLSWRTHSSLIDILHETGGTI